MGQDKKSCGTTQVDEKRPLVFTHLKYACRPDNGSVPRRLLLTKRLSSALVSPFILRRPATISPPAALFKAKRQTTTLSQRFIKIIIQILYDPIPLMSTYKFHAVFVYSIKISLTYGNTGNYFFSILYLTMVVCYTDKNCFRRI